MTRYYTGSGLSSVEYRSLWEALGAAWRAREKTGALVLVTVREGTQERSRHVTAEDLRAFWDEGTMPEDLLAKEGGAAC